MLTNFIISVNFADEESIIDFNCSTIKDIRSIYNIFKLHDKKNNIESIKIVYENSIFKIEEDTNIDIDPSLYKMFGSGKLICLPVEDYFKVIMPQLGFNFECYIFESKNGKIFEEWYESVEAVKNDSLVLSGEMIIRGLLTNLKGLND